ncbi:MAG: HD domain-containing protein [Nanoarchaeota archaeon]
MELRSPASSRMLMQVLAHRPVQDIVRLLQEYHHPTYAHSVRVALVATDIGEESQVNYYDRRVLCTGGLLHDIGKTRVPLAILDSPVALTEGQYRIMELHPRYGADIVGEMSEGSVRDIVVGHHERKASPYPRSGDDRREEDRQGLARRAVRPQFQRLIDIVAAADVCDALLEKRAYKPSLSIDDAARVARDQFIGDPSLVDAVLSRY